MGGLDARYMISRLGMASRVLSLTTIGTPHRGSSFAAWGVARLERLLRPLFRFCRWPYQAFYDLMPSACERFNREVPNVPGVHYSSVAGRCEGIWLGPEWRWPHAIVSRAEGPNDGVVSVSSATWGEHCEEWPGDHLNLVNWPNSRARLRGLWEDRSPYYARLVQRLADGGG
jgi:triacylglycerol lipase